MAAWRLALTVLSVFLAVAAAAAPWASWKGAPSALTRDVCIIGGGATGTYAAVRLQQQGKSVALIEKQSQLGGHVDTYTDPTTHQTVDYGVQIFSNLTVLTNFFSHFDVPLKGVNVQSETSKPVNFRTGVSIPGDIDLVALAQALLAYKDQLAKYPYLADGYDLPTDGIPEDLLLDFGEFIVKHDLQGMAAVAFAYNQGMANILAQPTLYVMKYFSSRLIDNILSNNFVVNALSNNQFLYDKAQAELGMDAFVNSNVHSIKRHANGVECVFSTPDEIVVVHAKKLLLTIPPKLGNLGFLDMDKNEQHLFSQFNNSYYWNGVVNNTGLPAVTLANADPSAPFGIPALPGLYTISPTVINGTHLVYYSSPHPLPAEHVKREILKAIKAIAKGQNITIPAGGPHLAAFGDHSPFMLTVSKEAVRANFYAHLQALQGKRNTWWTGAAWDTHATADLYNFTEYRVLPHLLG